MNISRIAAIQEAYKPTTNSKVKSLPKEDKRDSVDFSSEAKDFQAIKSALAQVPDVRKEKVENIMARMKSNSYHVSAKDIAEKMFAGSEMAL